ncbi:MAG: NAD(P)-dependent oxidoreductase [Bacteroidetes bacterium]|nr:NAD(P)-dependent oxidoreductase [Bacteroidota bacterium]
MKEAILITGASGFIGRHLVRRLLKNNYRIICFDLVFENDFVNEFEGKLEMQTGNLMDVVFIKDLINVCSPNYVFHFAGSKSRTNLLSEFTSSNQINYLGTLNLFESLIACVDLKLVTILGTIEEYGHTRSPFKEDSNELPNSAYGLSKLSATKLAMIFYQQFNLPVVVMRPSIAYGPSQGEEMFIPALIKSLIRQQPFKMTEGNQLRDFLYIDDLTDALIQGISCTGLEGQIVNIASGTSYTIRDVAMQIAEITKSKEYLKLGELPYRKFEIMDYTVDVSKASTLLQWQAKTKLSYGLKKTILFYQKMLSDEA